MKLIKLTDQSGETQNNTQWGENVTHTIPEPDRKTEMCGSGILHAYQSIEQVLLLNSRHADIPDPVVWEAEGEPVVTAWDKCGCHTLTTVSRIDYPGWYANPVIRQKVQVMFAVLCAEQVLPIFEEKYPTDDSPRKACEAARAWIKNPSDSTTYAATYAARSAESSWAVVYTTRFTRAAEAAWASAWAARSTHHSSYYAPYAASATASASATDIDITALARQAIHTIMGDL